jgi:hypothetical protein
VVAGAIEGARAFGLDTQRMASAAAAGALKAAGEIGMAAVDHVERVATGVGTMRGIKIAARAPFDLR